VIPARFEPMASGASIWPMKVASESLAQLAENGSRPAGVGAFYAARASGFDAWCSSATACRESRQTKGCDLGTDLASSKRTSFVAPDSVQRTTTGERRSNRQCANDAESRTSTVRVLDVARVIFCRDSDFPYSLEVATLTVGHDLPRHSRPLRVG